MPDKLEDSHHFGADYSALIDEREEFFEALAEEIEPSLQNIHNYILECKSMLKPLSHLALYSMFPGIESIRLGIYETARAGEFYSVNILFRALLEHTVKFKYLFIKTFSSNDDNVGIEYWTFGRRKENIDYIKNLAEGYALFGVKPSKTIPEMLKELGITSEHESEKMIKKYTEQFRFKEMVRYIMDQSNEEREQEIGLVSKFFPLYSQLSSFVHGGAQSTLEDSIDIRTAIDISSVSSLSARHMHFLAAYQCDKRLGDAVNLCKQYLDKYLDKFAD